MPLGAWKICTKFVGHSDEHGERENRELPNFVEGVDNDGTDTAAEAG